MHPMLLFAPCCKPPPLSTPIHRAHMSHTTASITLHLLSSFKDMPKNILQFIEVFFDSSVRLSQAWWGILAA